MKTAAIRTLIAVKVPPGDSLRRIVRRLEMMGGAVNPVATDALHVTLKLLARPTSRLFRRSKTPFGRRSQNALHSKNKFVA